MRALSASFACWMWQVTISVRPLRREMNANALHHKLLITSVIFFPWLCCPVGKDDLHETLENESATMEASSAVSLPTDTSLSLSEQVRIIITPACGSCHTLTLLTAKASAVRVFDLAREAWVSTMSPEQLERTKFDPPNAT